MTDLQPRGAWYRQLIGFVRREVVDLLRQPRLLLVLVAGPFLVLMLFAIGYDQQSVRLRTAFVGPAGGLYEDAIDSYGEDVEEYVEITSYTTDVVAAGERLASGDIDLVVVLPADPTAEVLAGRRAVITVIHDKVDPLQQTAVEISARVAVQELNAGVLELLVGQAQGEVLSLDDSVGELQTLVDALDAAAASGDIDRIEGARRDLDVGLGRVDQAIGLTERFLAGFADEADTSGDYDRVRQTLGEAATAADRVRSASTAAEASAATEEVGRVVEQLRDDVRPIAQVDPEVLVRPFVADTESLLRESPDVNDFFAPSAVALLLAHLAVTIAALALVRDESLGLFETFRVAPVGARHVFAGKMTAFALIVFAVGMVLVASIVFGLGVPLEGSWGWVVLCIALLALASITLGLSLSAVAQTDSQAVQYAMLALLAGMFFGGFFLSLDAFRFPIRLISWLLPVTYAIRWLQDVMLRGLSPARDDIAGLVGLIVVYGSIALVGFRRRLAVR